MSYDPFEVLQEKVAAPRLQREEQAAAAPSPSISLAEAAEQSGLPEAVLAAAVRKGTLNTRTIADDGVLRPGVQLDEVAFARESLLTRAAPPQRETRPPSDQRRTVGASATVVCIVSLVGLPPLHAAMFGCPPGR